MRTIKFRAKELYTGIWVYGSFVSCQEAPEDDKLHAIVDWKGRWRYIDIATVGQFTGLHDKNGVEIYEGDVVETFNYIPRDAKVELQIKNVVYKRHSFVYEKHDLDSDSRTLASEDCIVIGNNHETKEDNK